MSGIFGVITPTKNNDIHELTNKMSKAMSHREWFVAESHVDSGAGLSLGRIGIGIFNKTPQPVWNSSRTIALVMAGELYNRDVAGGTDASESDEQFALALYEKAGSNFASQLDGVFVIGIYDKRHNRFFIVNDRFALYPLYYACYNKQMIFAPEVKGILCDKDFPRKLDLTALAQYIRFQHLLGQRTFFEDIQMLSGGSILQYDISSGICTVKPYWSFNEIPYRPDIKFDEAVEETGMLFRRAVNRLSKDSYRPGVYLSGGLDSRSILGLMERRPVSSLTYGVQNSKDVYYAGRIAKVAGSDHHWVDLPNGKWVEQIADFHLELTEGFHSWIHAHGMSTLVRARELMDVNLTGWDGGTIMGGDDVAETLLLSSVDNSMLIAHEYGRFNQKYTWPSITEAQENMLYSDVLRNKMKGLAFESFYSEYLPYLDYRSDVRSDYFYIWNSCRRLTHNGVTFTRSHVEVRFPFFDYAFFDFLYSLPNLMRSARRLYRAMIHREIPRLAAIPYAADEFLPTSQSLARGIHAEMVKMKRRINRYVKPIFPEFQPLYADYEEYLRGDLREWAENILYDRQTTEREIFEPSFLRSLMNYHLSNVEEWTIGKIAPLVTYEMMLRRFYD